MEPGFYQGDKTPVLQNLIRDAALSSRSRLSLQVHKLLKKRIGCRDYTGVRLDSVERSTFDISNSPDVILLPSAVISSPIPSNSPEFKVVL